LKYLGYENGCPRNEEKVYYELKKIIIQDEIIYTVNGIDFTLEDRINNRKTEITDIIRSFLNELFSTESQQKMEELYDLTDIIGIILNESQENMERIGKGKRKEVMTKEREKVMIREKER